MSTKWLQVQILLLWVLLVVQWFYFHRVAHPGQENLQRLTIVAKDGKTPRIEFSVNQFDIGQVVFYNTDGNPLAILGTHPPMQNDTGGDSFSLRILDWEGHVRALFGMTSEGYGALGFMDKEGATSLSAFGLTDSPRVTFGGESGYVRVTLSEDATLQHISVPKQRTKDSPAQNRPSASKPAPSSIPKRAGP